MKLRYAKQHMTGAAVVLIHSDQGRRIEFHLRLTDEARYLSHQVGHIPQFGRQTQQTPVYSLISLAGPPQDQPDRHKSIGPFLGRDMALGAMNALIAALTDDDYEVCEVPAIWTIHAARLAREIREAREQSTVDCRFVPLGVPPEPPRSH